MSENQLPGDVADGPEQGALFEIEVDDDDGCVWLVTGTGEDARTVNLGPRRAVAGKFAKWLAAIDFEA